MDIPEPIRLLDPLFTTDAMRQVFSDHHRLQCMLDFEAALARALVGVGLAPSAARAPIESQCHAELFDVESLARATALSGNVAIPMVKALTGLVAKSDSKAAAFVHWGATSQDVTRPKGFIPLEPFAEQNAGADEVKMKAPGSDHPAGRSRTGSIR